MLLADEPTTALDVMVQAQILELLVTLTHDARSSACVILVTHDLPVVAQVCDRAAVMYAGEIVEMGAMSTIYHDPRHPYTRMLFSATPDLLATTTSSRSRARRRGSTASWSAARSDRAATRPSSRACTSPSAALDARPPGHDALCHLNDAGVTEAAS